MLFVIILKGFLGDPVTSYFLAQKSNIFEISFSILWIKKFPPKKSQQNWHTALRLKWILHKTWHNCQSEASIPEFLPKSPLKNEYFVQQYLFSPNLLSY